VFETTGSTYDPRVPLDAIKEWSLVCGGLVAHSDGVLDGEECERLMSVLELADDLDSEEYAEWVATVSDPARLQELFDTLTLPAPEHHRELLEQAWVMAVADGRRTDEEIAMLDRIATRFGVEPVQLEFWRDAWTLAEAELAAAVAQSLGAVLGGGSRPDDEDRPAIEEALWRTPCEADDRERLVAVAMDEHSLDEATRVVLALPRPRRLVALRRLLEAARASKAPQAALGRVRELAGRIDVPAATLRRWLEPA
jgi:uncharacterized tellurite resistance protein B-like protein